MHAYIHTYIHTYIYIYVKNIHICAHIWLRPKNIGFVTGPGELFATRLVAESRRFATNLPATNLLKTPVLYTLHSTQRPTAKVCSSGGPATNGISGHSHTHAHEYARTCIRICILACIHVFGCTCLYIYIYIVSLSVYMYMYTCVFRAPAHA